MKKKKRLTGLLALLTALVLVLTACGGASAVSGSDTSGAVSGETADDASSTDRTQASAAGDGPAVTAVSLTAGDLFSDRDLDPSYDKVTAAITLADGAVSFTGSGVAVSGDDVTITAAGVYVLTGTLTDGSVTVAAGEEDKVQLVLNGVSVTNSDGPALYVKSADKVFLTLADGSDNAFADGSGYTAEDDGKDLDAAVFSRSDLTINGAGRLTVAGNNKHGVVSKDDLVIVGATLTVTARNSALSGKDCVKIAAAVLELTAGTDGVHSDNDEDADRGFVYIHSGDITVKAGDDGVHAVTTLTVDGGTLTVTAAEGLEATVVTVNGGQITIAASDDGINAARKSSAYTPLVEINGGEITITMGAGDTDGVDSNGNIVINGGTISVTGNSTFDYEGTGVINGGTVIVNGQQVSTLPNQMMGGPGMGGPGMGWRP